MAGTMSMPRVIKTKLVGVTYENADGTSRQALIQKHCRPGTRLVAEREPGNERDPNAVGVWTAGRFGRRQLGHLSSDLASTVAPLMDGGCRVQVTVLQVTGGGQGQWTGLNVSVLLGDPPPGVVRRTSEALFRLAYAGGSGASRGLARALRGTPSAAAAISRRATEGYGSLPGWARPIVWGLGISAPIVTLMVAFFWLKG